MDEYQRFKQVNESPHAMRRMKPVAPSRTMIAEVVGVHTVEDRAKAALASGVQT